MKRFVVIIVIILTALIPILSEESMKPVQQIKEGEAAPYSGVLLPEKEYEKLFEAYQILEATNTLEKNLKYQVFKYDELIKLKNEEINYLKTKYNYEFQFRQEIQSSLKSSELKVKFLSITTAVGFSISLAELLGIGVFAIMYNTMK